MRRWLRRLIRTTILTVVVALVAFFGARIYQIEGGPPLEPWHTFVPQEMSRAAMERADFAAYLANEDALFDAVRQEVTDKLDPAVRVPSNRYFSGSPVNPGRFRQDWNRSFEMLPDGPPVGAVVLLHGLTDAPYSLRHIADIYRRHG
ncbi:MAG: alpha/beta hydrolase, partial [Rhizobiales bacterium]|nr:alpha/beta hydrolase [Hyphomicrobiales bacterium]